jgi:putative ABC transport system ATP-binding protein
MLDMRNLAKTYHSAQEQIAVLRGVCVHVSAGESVTLTGELGSGKSTFT